MKDFCKKHNITENQFLGKEKVGGFLDLYSVTSIPKGFNPTVGGSLVLDSLTSIPEGFNPKVGGDLDLRSVTSITEGFNPTVGGSLDLRNVTSIPEGFNPIVGGYLYLRSVTSIPEGFNPTVGGGLCLPRGLKAEKIDLPKGYVFEWEGGKYIKVDGVFCEVISKKDKVIYAKYINKAKAYNQDCENELYISEVRDLSQTPKHTTCLGYTSGPVELNEFRLKGRDLKYSSLGGNAFQCIYLIPTLEF